MAVGTEVWKKAVLMKHHAFGKIWYYGTMTGDESYMRYTEGDKVKVLLSNEVITYRMILTKIMWMK